MSDARVASADRHIREALYRAILEGSTDAVFIKDTAGRYAWANPFLSEALGKRPDEVVGRTDRELFPADVAERLMAADREVVSAGERRVFEYEVEIAGGLRRMYHVAKFPYRDEAGKILGVVGIARDITQRRRTELALKDSEERWRSLVANIPDFIVMVDRESRIQFINRAVPPLTQEGVVGTRTLDYIAPEHHKVIADALARVFATGEVVDYEVSARGPGGQPAWYSSRASPLHSDGRVAAAVIVARDITERRRGEQRLMIQNSVTQALSESTGLEEATRRILQVVCDSLGWMAGAVWRVDREGGVLRCVEFWRSPGVAVPEFERVTRSRTFEPGIGLPGRVWKDSRPAWIPDVVNDANFPRSPHAAKEGLHAAFGFPIRLSAEVVGVVEFFSRQILEPDADLLRMMDAVGRQIGQFMERKRAEETVRQSSRQVAVLAEERRLLLEHTRDFVYRHDANGVFTYLSPAVEQLTGYTADEWLTHYTTYMTDHPVNRKVVEYTEDALRTGREHPPYLVEIRHKDGHAIMLEVSERPFVEDGRVQGIIGVARDVTERHRAQEALREGRGRMDRQQKALVALTRGDPEQPEDLDAVFRRIVEEDAKALGVERVSVWRFNRGRTAIRCEALYELTPGRHSGGVELAAASYPAYFRALEESDVVAANDVLADPRTNEFADTYLKPLGIASMMDAPVFVHGVLEGVVCHEHVGAARAWMPDEQTFALAVSNLVSLAIGREERRVQEEAQRRLNAQLQAANRELEQFARVASHDLQEPLRKVEGFSNLLSRRYHGRLDAEADEFLEFVQDGCRRMRRIIQGLLELGRVTSAGKPFERVDLRRIADEVARLYEPEISRLGGRIDIEDLPPLHGDEAQLWSLMSNLVGNAVKYRAADRPPRIRIGAAPQVSSWEISVEDNGVGFPAGSEERMFEIFRRLPGAEGRPGFGIGLALCKAIAERHGGRIRAEGGKDGQGSRFVITLPMARREGAA